MLAESHCRVTLGHVRGVCPPSILLTLFVWTCDRPSRQFPVTLSPCLCLHGAGSTLFSSSLRSYLVCCLSHHQSVPLQTCIFITKSIFSFSQILPTFWDDILFFPVFFLPYISLNILKLLTQYFITNGSNSQVLENLILQFSTDSFQVASLHVSCYLGF